ncbi:MAG TPA: ABC transporter permease [Edaphobacter sp.]|nr:ABC transporter permease [Edaphobacter sp.]
MKLVSVRSFSAFNRATLKTAALLIPRRQRMEWLKEWQSELWHVRQLCGAEHEFRWHAEQDAAAFCFGAFQDARCLRQYLRTVTPRKEYLSSPVQCLLFLLSLAAAACCLFLFLPGARIAAQPSPYRDAQNLMLITRAGLSGTTYPTIRAEQYRAWSARKQQLFSSFAFYQIIVRPVTLSSHHAAELSIVRSSPNLFDLLGLPVQLLTSASGLPRLVLTDKARQRYFGKDQDVLGQVIAVGNRKVEVAGVVAAEQWRLPGRVDAWLLEPDDNVAAIPSEAPGFLIGHLQPSSAHDRLSDHWDMSVPAGPGDTDYLTCDSLSGQARTTFNIFLFMVMLAFLALPATTSLPLGEYAATHHKLAWSKRFRRWVFLLAKIALILPIVYFGSIDLAYLSPSISQAASGYIQIVASFSLCLFALRWTLRDQRKRCPVCLGKLTNPARVGQPSRTFLAWNGTELICAGGHGLLHVPEMPTSWFSTQRWLYLDSSWDVLFPEADLAAPGLS